MRMGVVVSGEEVLCRERKTVKMEAVGLRLLCFEKVAVTSGQTRALKRDPRKVHRYLHVLLST